MCAQVQNRPFSLSRRLRRSAAAAFAVALPLSLGLTTSVHAAGLIRDAETESLLRDYARPIFQAAGLGSQEIEIHIVNDKRFNAFVVDGHNMFINAGAIMMAKTPNELIGVIAHESGHIADGHLAAFRAQLAKAKSASLMLTLLGALATVGGAVAGSGNAAGAGMGVAMGGNEATLRTLLAYRQTQESAADQAGVRFLTATHQSARGMLDCFEMLRQQTFGIDGINPFLQTHPLPQQRIEQLRRLVTSSPYYDVKDPQELQFRHDLVRAKMFGFLDPPDQVFNRYPESDQSYPAYYARAIATYRKSGIDAAMPLLDALINGQPNWPYFHELKGQFLFESGKSAAAIPELETAVKLAPREPLIRIMLSQALLAIPTQSHVNEAIDHLKFALAHDPDSSTGYRELADAYYKKAETLPGRDRPGYIARADLASAEADFYEGQVALAKAKAKRAKKALPLGSPAWLEADDILAFEMPKTN